MNFILKFIINKIKKRIDTLQASTQNEVAPQMQAQPKSRTT